MPGAEINRFEWVKAVMQSDLLNSGAKLVASAMAVQFANDATGQLNPSIRTLADYLKLSTDTVKRAVKALVKAGWLNRSEGRGRGNKTAYQLTAPDKIIALYHLQKGAKSPQNKGGGAALLTDEKGANLREKGGRAAPSYIEQSIEQKGAALELARSLTFTGRNSSGPQVVLSKHRNRIEAWGRFIKSKGLGTVASIPLKRVGSKGEVAYAFPWNDVPEDPELQEEAISYFVALIDTLEVRHAAE